MVIPFHASFAIENISLSSGQVNYLSGKWQYFINDKRQDISAHIAGNDSEVKWQVLNVDNASFAYDRREYWFRFSLNETSDTYQNYILKIAYPLLD